MSLEQELKEIDRALAEVEGFVDKGQWNQEKNQQYAQKLADLDIKLNGMKVERLTEDEAKLVGELIRRLESAKCYLPSPPWV